MLPWFLKQVLIFSHQFPLNQGLRQRGAWGTVAPKKFLAPRWHLNFHARWALHEIRDLFHFFLVFLGNTIGILCKDSWKPLTVGTLTALAP